MKKLPKTKLLLVDNDVDFLETRCEFLKNEGYDVVSASSPDDAREWLARNSADIAILDIRLLDDDDDKDISGLELAKEVSSHLSVIILTGYPSTERARQSLEAQADGTRIAYHFVSKEEGPMALLLAIRGTVKTSSRQNDPAVHRKRIQRSAANLRPIRLNVPEQMMKDYELARLQANWIGWVRLGLLVGGMLVFLYGVIMVILGDVDSGILVTISGTIASILGRLITKFASDANRRWEQFHKELLLLNKRHANEQRKR